MGYGHGVSTNAAEGWFRYNNREGNGPDDATRAGIALRGAVGRRLLYRDSFVR